MEKEIVGSIRQIDLDTKIGRVRKIGGDIFTADFSGMTHAQIVEAFRIKGDVVITGDISKKKMAVLNVRPR